MATVNLLTASFDGKLGETYGAKWKSTHTIKAIPFSHAPHGEKATNAVRAFEKLNRIAGGIAKTFWPYLNLTNKKMLNHNAVAKWLKSLLVDNQFVITNFPAVVADNENAVINLATVNFSNGAFTLEATFSDMTTPAGNTQGAVLLVDENGKVIYKATFSNASFSYSGLARLDETLTYYALLLRSDHNGKKWVPNSFRVLAATAI